MLIERVQLDDRIARLQQFIGHSKEYHKLNGYHRRLLDIQLKAMIDYRYALNERIIAHAPLQREGDAWQKFWDWITNKSGTDW